MKRAATLCLLLAGLFVRPALANDTVYYYHTDAQGTAVVVTDASHNVVERTYYGPYGEVLNRPLRDGPGYTGHEEDAATGLDNMQQRYYDPANGRFPSPDPMEVDTATGGNFNRYAYAADNPYRYVDPDGRGNLSADQQEERRKQWQRDNAGSLAEKMPGVTAFLQGASALGSAPEMAGRAGLGPRFSSSGGSVSNNEVAQVIEIAPVLSDEMTPLEELPPGAMDGPGAGKAFPKNLGKPGPDEEMPNCIYCGNKTTREPGPRQLNRDHVIPKSRGGNNTPENEVPSCRTCNLRKGPRTPEEWYRIQKLLHDMQNQQENQVVLNDWPISQSYISSGPR